MIIQKKELSSKPGISIKDFNGFPPSLKIKQIHDELERKAKANGIAAMGLCNSAGIITLNLWDVDENIIKAFDAIGA